MELSPKQQAIRVIEGAKRFLLITHKDPDGDAMGSLLATKKVLEKLGKTVTTVAPGIIDPTFNFLGDLANIKNTIVTKKESRIVIHNVSQPVQSVTWRRFSNDQLEITVSGSRFNPADLKVENVGFDYEAIIILDSASQKMLGGLWEENADLFYEVPTINLDHHPSNTQFAKINIVDVTAAATAEILVSIFEAIGGGSDVFDPEIATCLLAGLTTDTNSFMNTNTTPKALTVAAQLVAAGGKQQEIVRRIFKTNSLAKLRVWGRVLSYIKEDRENGFIWSTITKADLVASGAEEIDNTTEGVIDSLLKTAEKADFAILLKEKADGVYASLRSIAPTVDVSAIARIFGGGGHTQAAGFQIEGKKIAEVEMDIINKIRLYQQSLKSGAGL